MDKLLLFPGKTEKGIFTYVLDAERTHLEKTAAEYHPTIASYIAAAKPIPGKTQILLTALGAGEFWGANVNGDYFPERALAYEGPEYGYKTFETHAKIYKHHINKDPTASFGDVRLAVYNPSYRRVELIVLLDNERAADVVKRIEAMDYPDWSMGCRVPYDVCSICGNKAPTRKEYCDHLRYNLGKIDPETGKQVYAINTMPRFHDISIVLIGADRIAKTLMKVAAAPSSANLHHVSSALLAEKMAGNKAAADKLATIEKEVPVGEAPYSQESLEALVRGIPEVKAREPELPPEVVDRLAREPLSRSLSTMAIMGMVPKPQEFQRIFLIRMGQRPLADYLASRNLCFDPMMAPEVSPEAPSFDLSPDAFDDRLMHTLAPWVPERSYYRPHLVQRIVVMTKQASPEYTPTFLDETGCKMLEEKVAKDNNDKERKPLGILPMLVLAAGAYALLNKKAPQTAASGLDKMLVKSPGLAAALGLSLAATFSAMTGASNKGQYSNREGMRPDTNDDLWTRLEAERARPFMQYAGEESKPFLKVSQDKEASIAEGVLKGIGTLGKGVSKLGPGTKRLLIGIPAAYMASGVLQKQKEANPYMEEGRARRFLRQYPDYVSGALFVDAMLSARGQGTHGLAKKIGPSLAGMGQKVKNVFGQAASSSNGLAKAASAEEWLGNALVWPLAASSKNLHSRILGGVVDQAVLEGGKWLASRKSGKGGIQAAPNTSKL